MPTNQQPIPGWPTIDDYDPDGPPRIQPAPTGMVWALAPNGDRVLAYLPPAETDTAAPATMAEPDKWPKRMLAGGASSAMVLGVVGHFGPGLSQVGHAIEMAGIGVAAAAAGVGALVMLVKGSVGKSGQNVHVNVSVNATGGNANARSSSRSRSK